MSSSGRRVALVAIVWAAALGAAATGCGLVVGAGDYVVGNVGDGSVGNPDADNPDGAGVPPVDGAVPGSDATSQADTSGPGVDGGTTTDGGAVCGPGGVVLPGGLPTGDPRFQQIVNACVLAVSCDPVFFDVTVSQCITNDYLATYPTKCLAGIKSCDDYYTCMGSRVATLAECPARSDMKDIGSCNGPIATSCFGSTGGGIISNCAATALGGTCSIHHATTFATFGDTLAGCQAVPSCAGPTGIGYTYCAGSSALYTCTATDTATNVGISRQSCPAGSTCQTSNGMAECFDTTTSCTTAGTGCVNGTLTTCLALPSGNEQHTNHCAAAGLSCTTSLNGTSACTAPGCANTGCTEMCVGDDAGSGGGGNLLQTCIGGAPYLVDCTAPALGFNTCGSGSSSTLDYAFCAYN